MGFGSLALHLIMQVKCSSDARVLISESKLESHEDQIHKALVLRLLAFIYRFLASNYKSIDIRKARHIKQSSPSPAKPALFTALYFPGLCASYFLNDSNNKASNSPLGRLFHSLINPYC